MTFDETLAMIDGAEVAGAIKHLDLHVVCGLARRAVAVEAERDELKRVLVEANAHRLIPEATVV